MIATEENRCCGSLCGFLYGNPLLALLHLLQATEPKIFYNRDIQALYFHTHKIHCNNN